MATRLDQIVKRVDMLEGLMGGANNELPQQRQAKNVLGMTRLRRA